MKLPRHPREAKPASIWVNVGKTLVQIVFMWGFFLFLVPPAIVWFEALVGVPRFHLSPWVGVGCFLAFSALGLTSGMLFAVCGDGTPLPLDTARKFVVLGPYRYLRNPMALAGIGQGFGIGLYQGSPLTLVYSVMGAFAWHYLARPWEEADLIRRFGREYEAYRSAVPLWLPTWRRYSKGERDA